MIPIRTSNLIQSDLIRIISNLDWMNILDKFKFKSVQMSSNFG